MVRPTQEEIEAYLSRMGKHGVQTLSTLGKLQPYARCIETDLGKAILSDLINRHEELLDKIANMAANDNEKIEFTVVKRMLLDLSSKINAYNDKVAQIKKASQ